jgi:putative membrane protein
MSPSYQLFNRQVRSSLIALAGAALLTVPSAIAQAHPSSSPSQSSPTQQQGVSPLDQANANQDPTGSSQMADKAFVHDALEGGMAEVQLGQLALQKSSNDDVKQFAQKMIDDHTKLGDEMKQVAVQMKLKVPDSPSKKDKSAIAKLQALNGDDFDKAYIKDMVKDHQQDLKDFKQEAQNTQSPDLKKVVNQGGQVIEEHLQMIQQIAQKNNVVASK